MGAALAQLELAAFPSAVAEDLYPFDAESAPVGRNDLQHVECVREVVEYLIGQVVPNEVVSRVAPGVGAWPWPKPYSRPLTVPVGVCLFPRTHREGAKKPRPEHVL